jgi:heat shock protein HtpX
MQASAAPPRHSLKGWAVLAILLIILSYVFTVLLAAACTVLPYLLMTALPFNINLLFLVIGGVLTSLTILWSLAPRRQIFQAPGPPMNCAQSPRLFAEFEAIAGALHEPMPKQVYLIPDVDGFVTEHGGTMGFGTRRIMALGLPLMRVLTISQFRALIAHEFGHYYSGDTNLGPWIYRTSLAMHRTLVNLRFKEGTRVPGAVAVIRVLVMAMLGGYWKVFLRITFVVSRKQEFRADELACWLGRSR